MKNLQLSLKGEWFKPTKAGIKTEDYREITPYFCKMLLTAYWGFELTKKQWYDEFFENTTIEETIEHIDLFCTFKPFKNNIMTLGYPKKTDLKSICTLKHEGIEIREGHQEWGARKGVKYFVIKHGELT